MELISKICLDIYKRKYILNGRRPMQDFYIRTPSTIGHGTRFFIHDFRKSDSAAATLVPSCPKRFYTQSNDGSPMSDGYQPTEVESNNPSDGSTAASRRCSQGTFRMILPPPNVTGQLHLGHALMATVQDVICRRHRQLGFDVEWIPGTDHAGIATQVVVEKKLLKERGQNRQQIGREAFLREVWQWKNEKCDSIIDDLKKLGCTLNWEREYFTMDERQSNAVNTAFIKLFEDGLIKRQKSLVNWSCALESAVSDIEVDTLELKGPTEIAVPGYSKNVLFGKLYNFSYKIVGSSDSNEEIIVSTTRPETMLGDIAVAVHPEDPRYIKYRDVPELKLWHPFRKETIPLIYDITVEREFGTGAVKITPAHDKKDFEIASRHLLEGKQVFTEDGKIVSDFENFNGLPRFEARERILQTLAEMELLRGSREHSMNLPVCSRSKDIIEYMLREQWFVHCQPMADAAMAEVRSGRLQIVPENYEIEWHRWLEDCRDWCISRQLWWGHQIPAYYAESEQGETCWVAALNENDALQKAEAKLNTKKLRIKRDTDVLDTWFSSALLPFSLFNWPAKEYRECYPLDLMETGHDILFFWVARMTMLGLQLTGEIPFKKILLNGIVCDAHGRKMSKSLGNIVTPQQVVKGATLETLQGELQKSHESGILNASELKRSMQGLQKMFPKGIPECGTDALRLTLCSHNIKSHFINFDVSECYTNKLFLNKIWQATRFLIGSAESLRMPLSEVECLPDDLLGKWDRWILGRLAHTLRESSKNFDDFNLHADVAALKQFFYANICDVYLETTKPMISAKNERGYLHCATLAACLSWGLHLMAPFAPFVATKLLGHLRCNIHLNLNGYDDPKLEAEINEILDVCQVIRQLKSRNKISKKHDPHVSLYAQTPEAYEKLREHILEIQALTLTNGVQVYETLPEGIEKTFSIFSTAGHLCSFGITTNETYAEAQRNENLNRKKLEKLQAELERYRLRVESEGFRKSASEEVQQRHSEKIKKLEIEIRNIEALEN